MRKVLPALACALLTAAAARAHFVFVVPAADGKTARVVLGESLDPDEGLDADKLAALTLAARDAAGKDTPLTHTPGEHCRLVGLPGTGGRVVFGTVVFGVRARAGGKPFLLAYHPKAVVGAVAAAALTVGGPTPVEIVPAGARLRVLAGGKPAAGTEVTVLKPDGKTEKVTTDAAGLTPGFAAAGRYGAWARTIRAEAGEHGGKKYEEIRHYATLVAELGGQ